MATSTGAEADNGIADMCCLTDLNECMPDEGVELWEQIAGLLREAMDTPGAHVDFDLRTLSRSLELFTSNAAHLRVEIEHQQRIESWIKLGPDNQSEFEKCLDEIDRLLHNFLAAAFTLATHTMKIRKKYADDALATAYDSKSPFGQPLFKLVKELRNDTQHAHLPLVRQNINIVMDAGSEWTCTLVVSRQYLATLKLNGPTRKFLEGLGDDPSLAWLVETYTLAVEQFTAWFVGAVVLLRAEDLALTHLLRRRAAELMESATPSRRDS